MSQADSEREANFEVQCATAVSQVTSNPNAKQTSAFKRLDDEIEKRFALVTTRSQSLSSPDPVSTSKLDEELSVLKLRKAAWDILSFQRNSQLPTPLVLGSSKFSYSAPTLLCQDGTSILAYPFVEESFSFCWLLSKKS